MKERVKTALITGATSGIGESTAHLLADEGYNLIITGRRATRLRDLKRTLTADYDIEVLPLVFDIRDRNQCEAHLNSINEHFGTIDVLVNNAGLSIGLEPVDQGDLLDWDAMIDTNIKGMLYVTRKISRLMIEQGFGHIVNIGSIVGTQIYENAAVYCASKHAVHALSTGMRIDMVKHGIKVTEIRPGMVETEFSLVRFEGDAERADKVYEGITPLTPCDVAEAIVWAISQPAHVNIDEILLTPVQQATVHYLSRK